MQNNLDFFIKLIPKITTDLFPFCKISQHSRIRLNKLLRNKLNIPEGFDVLLGGKVYFMKF